MTKKQKKTIKEEIRKLTREIFALTKVDYTTEHAMCGITPPTLYRGDA